MQGSALRLVPAEAPPIADGQPTDAPALLLTAADLARELRLSVKSVSRMNSAGKLPRPVRIGKAPRWPRDQIVRWIAAGAPSRAEWERWSGGPKR